MRILQVGKFYPIVGGVEKVMYDIVEGLSAMNDVRCDMLCASAVKGKQVVSIGNGRIICMPTWFKAFATMISPMMVVKLREIANDYDIIHIHHPDPMAALALWLSGYKGKVVLHWHADILKQKMTLRLYKPLQRWLINRADVIVGTTTKYLACSPFLQDKQLKKVCIPIGIDPVVYDSKQVEALHNTYAGKKIIFSLGRLVGYKGYEYLIEAANYLPDNYMILIGGDGPLKSQLLALIEQNDLQDKVKLLGRISDEDLPTYYGMCDLYVISSIWKTEAFGIVQIEAMSCGKPVIATKIPGSGVDWVNEDDFSGVNVEPMDAKAIATAVKYLLGNTEVYNKFAKNAKSRYDRLFRKSKMINNCLELYRNL